MVVISFPDRETAKKAVGFSLGRFSFRILFGVLAILAGTSCSARAQADEVDKKIKVSVARPVQRQGVDFAEYTGKTQAMSVAIMAQVTGRIVEMPFKEGAYVKAGDILFKVDPSPYQAQVNAAQSQYKAAQFQLIAAKSQVKAAKAQLKADRAKFKYDTAVLKRYTELDNNKPGSVTVNELDLYKTNVAQGKANIALTEANIARAEANVLLGEANRALAEANFELAKSNLESTTVKSPIDGHIGRYFLKVGNLVEQDSPALTTVVSVDPMYVYFDMDKSTILRARQAMNQFNEGKIKHEGRLPSHARFASMVSSLSMLQALGAMPGGSALYAFRDDFASVYLRLPGEEDFQDVKTKKPRHAGTVNFLDNTVNAGADSIQARGRFANPMKKDGSPMLVPGMFVRVRLPIEESSLLVTERAIITNQWQKKLLVINAENKVEERVITPGPLLDDGLRVVSGKNIGPDDWVIFTPLQWVRPGMEVNPEFRTMPELGKASEVISEKGKKADKAEKR